MTELHISFSDFIPVVKAQHQHVPKCDREGWDAKDAVHPVPPHHTYSAGYSHDAGHVTHFRYTTASILAGQGELCLFLLFAWTGQKMKCNGRVNLQVEKTSQFNPEKTIEPVQGARLVVTQ